MNENKSRIETVDGGVESNSMFLVFEGVDGSGKSTQLKLCQSWLESLDYPVTVCRDPGSTALGNQIRELLLNRGDTDICFSSEMFLFMASRAQLVHEIIRPALANQKIILCDRFLMSTVVYQGHAGALEPDSIWRIGEAATGGLQPTLTLVFDVPVDIALHRVGQQRDSMESRGADYLSKVRTGFLKVANSDPQVRLIDARHSAEDIHEKVRETLSPLLKLK